MPRRISVILMSLVLLCGFGGRMAWSFPAQDYTLLGTVSVDGVLLTSADPDFGGYSIFLQVDAIPGEILVTYVLGSNPAFEGNYVLKVPMSTAPRDADRALTGDTAHIFIDTDGDPDNGNEVEVDQSPQVIGIPAGVLPLPLTASIPPGQPVITSALVASASPPDFSKVALTWIAPGGNEGLGTVTGYEGVISTVDPSALNEAALATWWSNAAGAGDTLATNVWTSLLSHGETESRTATLNGNPIDHDSTFGSTTYYVGLRATGSVGPIDTEAVNQPPKATALSISPGSPTTSSTLSRTYAYQDPEGDPSSGSTLVEWYMGGAHQSAYDNATEIPSSATAKGQVWRFEVQPHDGNSFGPTAVSGNVTIQNTPPTAEANGPYTGKVNEPIPLSSTGSTDPDPADIPLNYSWDYDASVGTDEDGDSTQQNPSPTYTTAGVYTVTLKVSDDTDSDKDTATVTVTDAELEVAKVVDDSTPGTGDTIVYTITITNNGPDGATGVVVNDDLPAGVTYVSYLADQGSYNNGSGLWSVGALTNGGSVDLDITATVDLDSCGEIINTASVEASYQGDSVPGNNEDSASINIVCADLSIEKTVDNEQPEVGQNVTYTITVTNNGPDTANNIVVNDLLPAEVTYVSHLSSQGTYYPSGAFAGDWDMGSLTNGSIATLDITVTVTDLSAVNTATITALDQSDPDPSNDSDTLVFVQADVAISASVDNDTPNQGDNITVTTVVTNNGPDPATNVSVTGLGTPLGFTYVSHTVTQGSYVPGTDPWDVGSLANGASATFIITATVSVVIPQTCGFPVGVMGTVDLTEPDPDLSNNTDTISVTVQCADMEIAKTVDNETPNEGDTIVYSIIVTNNGPSVATDIQVSDLLPPGVTYSSYISTTGAYDSTTGTWTPGSLPALPGLLSPGEASSELLITATVDAGTCGQEITNTASVSQTQADTEPGNNTDDALIIVQCADLEVTKVVDNETPKEGETIEYTITLTNNGPDYATNVVVTDLLPTELTYVSSTPDTYNNGTGAWTVGDVDDGEDVTLTIVATVNTGIVDLESCGVPITNTASVTAVDQADSNDTNNSDTADITVECADLAITKSVDNDSPTPGNNVTYTIRVTNNGPASATGVVVGDLLPTGVTYVSSNAGPGTYDSGTGLWVVGVSLNSGAYMELTITATVDVDSGLTSIVNTASVAALDQVDPNSSNDSDSATIDIKADLAVTKTVNNGTPNEGDSAIFTVTLTNNGPGPATNVEVTDPLPAGLTVGIIAASQGSYSVSTGVWTVGDLANDASVTLTLTMTVDSGTCAQTITNTATVTASDQEDPNPANNSANVSITVQCADLALSKSVDNNSPNEGDTVTFTVTLTNNGPDTATNIDVTDAIPTGLTCVSHSSTQGSCDPGTGVWTVNELASGSTATLTIGTSVDSGTCAQTLTNAASITAADQADPVTSNNGDSASVTVKCADLALTKIVDDDSPNEGDKVTFTVTLTNNGPDHATNVVVSDVLPAGLTYSSAGWLGGSFSGAGGVWSIGSLSNGSTITLTIRAWVDSDTCGQTITNTATVVSADQADPVDTNNSASVALTVQCADLAVTKTVDNDSPNVGDTVTFTVTVTNNGPDTATNIDISDVPPAGLSIRQVIASQGVYNAVSTWVVGDLANGATAQLTFDALIDAGACANTITNTASVASVDQADPVAGNNSASAGLTVQCADLAVTKTVDNASPNEGDEVSYVVTVTNNGPDYATNVEIADLLPPELTYVSDTSDGNYADGVWDVGELDDSEQATITITASVNTGTCSQTITNTASVTAVDQADSDTSNNSDSTDITVQCADLAVVKTVSDNSPNEGDEVSYVVTVTNNGPDDATNVVVNDLFPAGLTFTSVGWNNGSYNRDTGVWTMGRIYSGSNAELNVSATINSGTCSQTITNTATVTSVDQADSDPSNNSDSAALTVQCADLAVTKTVDNAEPNILDNIEFVITVTNNGPSYATNVKVTDPLPSELTYVSDTSGGSYAGGVWDVGELDDGEQATLTIIAKVNVGTGGVTVTNTAEVDGDQADPNSSNNSASVTLVPVKLRLVSASYEVCTTTLTLVFNDPIDPAATCFDFIDMEIADSGNEDFGLTNQLDNCLVAVPGVPYPAGEETHYPVTIDILCDVPAVSSLAIAAFMTHRSNDIDLLMKPGAFSSPDGAKSPAADVPLLITAKGLELRRKGDLTGDGIITAYDAGLLLQFAVFGRRALPVYDTVLDVANWLESFGQPDAELSIIEYLTETDGRIGITANDAAALLRYCAGITNDLPANGASAPVADMTNRNGRLVANSYDDQRLEVSIDLSDVRGIHSADIVLTYNPQAMKVTDVSETSAVAGWLSAHGTPTPGQLKVALAGVSQPTEDGSIITVSFDTVSADAIKQLDLSELKLNGIKATVQNLPKAFALLQNYPNPFNPETWIPYHLSEPVDVNVAIYSITGQMVRRLELGNKMPGSYVDRSEAAYWDGKNEWGEKVSSGIYFYQLQAGRDAAVKKMIIVQ